MREPKPTKEMSKILEKNKFRVKSTEIVANPVNEKQSKRDITQRYALKVILHTDEYFVAANKYALKWGFEDHPVVEKVKLGFGL